ncbi:MAG: protein jag [Actinobacteria bacterium]|nr:protein jag [Actinomycetota bacterium]
MKSVEKKGRTVDEAVAAALAELGAVREEAVIEILEEPNKGFLGLIGGKGALVRVIKKERKEDVARRVLKEIGEALGLQVQVEGRADEESVVLNLRGSELGILIGRRGQTLDAIQYLVNLAASKNSLGRERIILDVEGYRQRRAETLERLATRLAERVRRTGESVALEPMSAHERRVIHLALQENPYVTTHSEGEEPFRKIVISAKD